MDASIIVTYRCPMRCKMCNIWENPTKTSEEFKPELLKKLPQVNSVNITGGEPFVREDIEEIVKILSTKTQRIVFSTSGYFSERIIALAKKFPTLGYRISIEGLSCKNDELRGRAGGFDKGLRTLLELRRIGIKDIGFGITVSNNNSEDMLHLYELSRNLKMQFATASFHNSFYFHKYDNQVTNIDEVCANFDELIQRLMKENSPKSWFRAFFNLGLINYIKDGRRMLPCEAGTENFFVDPFGNVLPCNGMEKSCWFDTMGNLNDVKDFMEIWNSERAAKVREKVASCSKSCWMIGSASPVMKKYLRQILPWVIKNKLKVINGGKVDTSCVPFYHVGNNAKQGIRK
ncbi:radical SAM protein [Parabacteroides pacaensis]|uniref:radical SAM protein n=1 Tax=Parabacteroides pacaensis TaxID=2086575 RepID=UPI000D0FF798|nr:radical SAM protein [Parabacteroides pacaensis]